MRVATWNVRHGRPRHGLVSNRRLARAVNALDVDVLAVQEVDRRVVRSWFADQPQRIALAMDADSVQFAAARHHLLLTGEDGVALCVRGTLARQRVLALPHDHRSQRRVAVIASTTIGDESATVVATHLHNEAGAAKRQLDALLDEIADEERPRLLLGDLNLCPDDVAAPLAAAGFTVVDAAFTEPAWAPAQRIDHVAVDGLTAGHASVPSVDVSDHRPVVVEVKRARRPAP